MSGGNCTTWQESKSVTERNCHMLENQIATDVCFELTADDDSIELVRAHKYILISRSPVFEAMFTGPMVEGCANCGNIKIPDIDVATFRRMLRYMYCDSDGTGSDFTAAEALPLLYAAKKYFLRELVTICSGCLQSTLNLQNVCATLEHSILLEDNDLEISCMKLIVANAKTIMNGPDFLQLSSAAVLRLLLPDHLNVGSERHVYECCLKWAKHKLRESSGIEHPSDVQIRATIEPFIYFIRFLTMTWNDFAAVAQSDVLTASEKHDISVYLDTQIQLETLLFDITEPRNFYENEQVIDRFQDIEHGWSCDGCTDAIKIWSNVDVYLTAIGLFGGMTASSHDVMIEILDNDYETLSISAKRFTSDGGQTPIRVLLAEPVLLLRVRKYHIAVTMKGPQTFSGACGDEVVVFNRCAFCSGKSCSCRIPVYHFVHFFDSAKSDNSTDVSCGQIPQIFFSVA